MKTGLGLSFLRVVNEEGYNGWAQVYARIPFEESEIKRKGALFGVVFSKKLEGWEEKESEIMAAVDGFFNEIGEGGALKGLIEKIEQNYPELEGVWLWVSLIEQKRIIRMVKMGGGGLAILRKDQLNNLSGELVEGRIIKGEVRSGDRVMIWTEDLGEYLNDLCQLGKDEETAGKITNEVMEKKISVAGMCFDFGEEELMEESAIVVEKLKDRVSEVTDFEQPQERVLLARRQLVGKLGMKEKIINWVGGLNRKKGRVVIEGESGRRKKLVFGLGVMFLLLLIVSVGIGSLKINKQRSDKKWSEFAEPIEKKIGEARTMSTINLVSSRKLIEEARNDFQLGETVFEKTRVNELKALEGKLNESWSVTTGEKQAQLDRVVDLQLIREGFNGSRVSLSKEGVMLVLEPTKGLIAEVTLSTKDVKILAGKGEGLGWQDVTSDTKRSFVMDKSGIGVMGKSGHLVDFDTTVSNPVALWSFGTNLYLLDQGNREIYRYPVLGDTVGERQRWFKLDAETKFVKPTDIALDGDIWIVGGESSLERFRRGAKEVFSLNGVPTNSKFVKVSVSPKEDKVALLDNENSCVVLFDKASGNFLQKFKMDGLRTAQDLEYDNSGTLWILMGGQLGVLK